MVDFRPNPLLFRSTAEVAKWGRMVADAYLAAPAYDVAEAWRWDVLAEHIHTMFRRIQRGKNGVEVRFVPGQPYDNAAELKAGVASTGVLLISYDDNEHPVFDAETNLAFRAVHDYVVHIGRDVDFTLRGEIAAYNARRAMTPPDAVPALFSEIVGQASVSALDGFFPAQKIALLPFDYYYVGVEVAPRKRR